ncbi:DUF5958 family protein [Streptomyces sp. WMMC940]|uniref:DUF5958 family protein n=1 Tax=Streptomyces sp. WMMC940 TaxID=3015153 RepID=UPI0022B67A9B|nr:DUF5958 family protein [Streptomyces sp. WMMC940]MCZ7462330.1 DUF5958 family protein [Streptomyces sp. WMMC940]
MNERDVPLNELAKDLRPRSEGIEQFDDLVQGEQSEALPLLRHHCVQASAVAEDAPESIRRGGRQRARLVCWTRRTGWGSGDCCLRSCCCPVTATAGSGSTAGPLSIVFLTDLGDFAPLGVPEVFHRPFIGVIAVLGVVALLQHCRQSAGRRTAPGRRR